MSSESFEKLIRNAKSRRSVRVWSVQGKLSGDEPARLNLAREACGYPLREPGVYRVLDDILNPRGISVDACIEAAEASLKAGCVLADLQCPKCK